jgi:hypothetical protein
MRTVLATQQYNLSFCILFALSISNVGLTYKTIADEMPWCSTENAKESLCRILSLGITIVHVSRCFGFGSLIAHSLG